MLYLKDGKDVHGNKIELLILDDKIDKISEGFSEEEIKNIEYQTKRFGNSDYYSLKITKTNKKVYKYRLGLIEEEVLEIFTIIKENYEEWRIKKYESCNKEN